MKKKKKSKLSSLLWASKLVFLALCFFIFVGSSYLAVVCMSGKESEKWAIYENSRYGFKIKYPVGWKLEEAPFNNEGRGFTSKDGKVYCYAYGFFNAIPGEYRPYQTLEEFADWFSEIGGEMMRKEDTRLGGWRAKRLVRKERGQIFDCVYALGKETGRGFYCVFDSEKKRREFKPTFEKMKESFEIFESLDGVEAGTNYCANYINNLIEPVADLVSFSDTNYTEVTTTSRENWDKEKLPEKVLELEKEGYSCFPEPAEFGKGEEPGVNIEREVKKVNWRCELRYNDYQYLVSGKVDRKRELEAKGYICEIANCIDKEGKKDYVWLCGK